MYDTWTHLNGVLHKFLPSVCVCVYVCVCVLIAARQRLGKNVAVVNNTGTHAIYKLLDASFSMWSVPYQTKVGDYASHILFSFYLALFLLQPTSQSTYHLTCITILRAQEETGDAKEGTKYDKQRETSHILAFITSTPRLLFLMWDGEDM
jgi:hypothetical protein